MNVSIKFLLDQSPRQLYYFFRKKLITRAPLQEFNNDFPCVFVLSTGRVGTETLNALFGLTDNLFSYHEPSPILYGLSKLSYEYSHDVFAREILKEAFWAVRRDLLKYSLDCQRGFIETSPQVSFLAPVIAEAVPNVRFIHVTRDPRLVVRSGMRRKWFDGHPNDGTRIIPKPNSYHALHWKDYSLFQKNVWLWNETNRWIMEFASGLSSDRILTLRSEDVFSMDRRTLLDLYGFVGARIPPQRKISYLLQKKMNSQQIGEFPTSALWSAEQKKELINMASETAGLLGYDLLKDYE